MRRGLVPLLALLLTTCETSPLTSPTRQAAAGPAAASAGAASNRSARADWLVEIVRAPASGQAFRLNKEGKLPQPAPQFRFKVTPAVDVPQGTFTLQLLNAGSKACGIATLPAPIAFTANQPTTLDVRNDTILVGPNACAVPDSGCKASQCKLPLTTTKLRFVFGDGATDLARLSEARQYKWSGPSTGGGSPSPPALSCGGQPAPDTVGCGVPVARCVTGGYACSDILPCWNRGHVVCYVCPGPLCCHGPGPICQE